MLFNVLELFSRFWPKRVKSALFYKLLWCVRPRHEKLIFHWFYKVLLTLEITMRRPSVDNAFSMHFGNFSGFCPKKILNTIGFIRFSASVFWLLKISNSHWFLDVFWRLQNALRKVALDNAFSIVSELFCAFLTKFRPFDLGFYKVLRMRFSTFQKVVFLLVL